MPVNIGEIFFGVTADLKNLNKSVTKIREFANVVEQAALKAEKGQKGWAERSNKLLRQQRALNGSFIQTTKLQDKLRDIGGQEATIIRLTGAFKRLTAEMTSGPLTAHDYQKAMQQFRLVLNHLNRSISDHVKIKKELDKTDKTAANTAKRHARLLQNIKNTSMLKEQRAEEAAERKRVQLEQAAIDGRLKARMAETKRLITAENATEKAIFRATQAGIAKVESAEMSSWRYRLGVLFRSKKLIESAEAKSARQAKSEAEGRVREADRVVNALNRRAASAKRAQVTEAKASFRNLFNKQIRDQIKADRDQAKAAKATAAEVVAALKKKADASLAYQKTLDKVAERELRFTTRARAAGAGKTAARAEAAGVQFRATTFAGQAPKAAQAAMAAYRMEMAKTEAELKKLTQTSDTGAKVKGKYTQALHRAANAATLIHGPLGGAAARLHTLAAMANSGIGVLTALGLAAGAAAYGALKLSKAVLENQRDLSKAERTLTAMTGSHVLAQNEMKELMELADRAGVSFKELLQPYAQWHAAIKETNMEGQLGWQTFEKFTFVASTFGLSAQQSSLALRALTQMISKGSVAAEELRGQFGEQIAGAFQNAAKAMGKTTTELGKLLKEGKVDPIEFIPKLMNQYVKLLGLDIGKEVEGIIQAENRWANMQIKLLDSIDKTLGISRAYIDVLRIITTWGNNYAKTLQTQVEKAAPATRAFDAVKQAVSELKAAWEVATTVGKVFVQLLDSMGGEGAAKRAALAISDLGKNTLRELDTMMKVADQGYRMLPKWSQKLLGFDPDSKLISLSELYDKTVAKTQEQIDKTKELADRAAGLDKLKVSIEGSSTALTGGLAPLDKWVEAMKHVEDLNPRPEHTIKYWEEARAGVEKYENAIASMKKEISTLTGEGLSNVGSKALFPGPTLDRVNTLRRGIEMNEERLKEYQALLMEVDRIQQLPTSRNIKKVEEIDEASATRLKAQLKGLREFGQELQRLRDEEGALRLGPDALDRFRELKAPTKEIQDMKDKLVDLLDKGVKPSQEQLKEMQDEVKKFDMSNAIAEFEKTRLATARLELELKRTVTPLQFAQTAFDKLANTGVDKFVDAIMEGTLSMETLREVGKSVVADLMKEFIKLAAIAPLKNMLFGTTDKTFGFLSGGAPGVGGLLGNLFGGSTTTTKSARGNVFMSGISGHSNSVVSSPTIFPMARGAGLMGESGPEAVMPLVRRGGRLGVRADISDGGGGGDVVNPMQVNIFNQTGARVTATQEKQGDISVLKVMVRDIMIEDTAQNGPYTRANNRIQGKRRFG